ncbi:trehalose phosphorylase [Tuber brumale]|nr:trehalose phosphorylase [Tuber brumale]
MHGSEAPHAVADPIDTSPSQIGRTEETVWGKIPLVPLYIGMAATRIDDKTVKIGLSIHDGLYTKDYSRNEFTLSDGENIRNLVKENTINTIETYSTSNRAKFVGAGVTLGLEKICPGICAHIWKKLDIIRAFLKPRMTPGGTRTRENTRIDVGKKADMAARECVRYFGRDHNPALTIGFRNKVMPDAARAIRLVEDLQEYKDTVHESTWNTVLRYAYELRGYKDGQTSRGPQSAPTKITFFSATPQGGGEAPMRHALIRFCSQLGVDMSWYIPEPDPEAFKIAKTNDNILQYEGPTEARFDVVIIDDPQMAGLIPLIKNARPEVKFIYRSHIEVRQDLLVTPWSPQEQLWGGFGVTTDKFRLDGLNKPLGEWDLRFYHHNLRNLCNEREMNHLLYPTREYITQIARFDPSKGIPDVIGSYRKLCLRLRTNAPEMLPPQLLICGHGAIDDADAEIAPIAKDVILVRIGPSDQMLNAMITTAKVVVQLSLREGFQVKVSEALHHGKPVVATRAGGIPLQIEDGKSGFLVEVGDTDTVANRLFDLYTNDDLYARMSNYAKANVSDDVGTVGNVAGWLYLAVKLARGEGLEPNTRWIMDIPKEEAGQKYETGELKHRRTGIDFMGKAMLSSL